MSLLEEIEIHFKEMKQIGEALSEVSDGLQKMIDTKGIEVISSVRGVWDSKNTATFIRQGMEELETLRELAIDLQRLSEDVLERARQIYEVEKINTMTAFTRNYR